MPQEINIQNLSHDTDQAQIRERNTEDKFKTVQVGALQANVNSDDLH